MAGWLLWRSPGVDAPPVTAPLAASSVGVPSEPPPALGDGAAPPVGEDLGALIARAAVLPNARKFAELAAAIPSLSPDQLKKLVEVLAADPRFSDVKDLLSEATAPFMAADPEGFLNWMKATFSTPEALSILLFAMEKVSPNRAEATLRMAMEKWKGDVDPLLANLMGSLAIHDPPAAFRLANAVFANSPRQMEAKIAVLETWAQTNPSAALDLVMNLPGDSNAAELSSGIWAAWYLNDPQKMEAYVLNSSMPDSIRQKGLAIVAEYRATENSGEAVKWMESLPSQMLGPEVLVNVTGHLALDNPQESLKWNARIAEAPLRELNRFEILQKWAISDADAVKAYLKTNPLTDKELQARIQSALR